MFFSNYKLHKDCILRRSLLWEYDWDKIDWQAMKPIVVQRVLERGRISDFYAILNLYGLKAVKETFCQLPYMNKKDINFVCTIFGIKKESLKCCTQKQSRPQHWNS